MSRWKEEEQGIIKDVFKDEGFVIAVRDVMLGLQDKFEHKTTDGVLKVLKKNLLPEFEASIPLKEQQDLCHQSVDFITGFNSEEAIKRIEAYDLADNYLKNRFGVICGIEPDKDDELLKDLKAKDKAKDNEDRFVRMLAYLIIGKYVDNSLDELVRMANEKELTPEEVEERQKKDSNK